MLRVAIYTRVSTDDQAKEGFSLGDQRDRLGAFCLARGWDVAGVYVDDGHSGRDTRRPAYQQMMDERECWDVILVAKMDRIHRNSRHFMEMMDDLARWKKGFSSMQESFDTSTAIGRFVMDIIQRIAQLESEQIGERVYMGMREKAQHGTGILGFAAPLGFDFRDGGLVVNEEEADTVRKIFRRCVEGASIAEIAGELAAEGAQPKRGGRWTPKKIHHILHNPIYAGALRWDDVLRAGEHPAIVEPAAYNDAQIALQSRVRIPSKRMEPQLLEV